MKLSPAFKRVAATLLSLTALALLFNNLRPNDLHDSSVMIVNRAMTSGGTGIVLKSSAHKTEILTNAHVCKLVKTGGLVVATTGTYQVASVRISEVSDLCLLEVLDNLGVNTRVASGGPVLYQDFVKVSGHPALMPNVISNGQVSGKAIIPVLIDIKACSEEDIQGENGILCAFLGGIPVVKYYESVLTSATIMPGSSGSGVYNNHKNLIGVVFAGSSEFGYSWTVPYEQLRNFLDKELATIAELKVQQEMSFSLNSQMNKDKVKEARAKCATTAVTDPKLKDVCTILSFDMIWRK